MKKLLLPLFFCFIGSLSQAQSNDLELEYYQDIFGMEKKVVIANLMKESATDDFWIIYNEYETKRKALSKKRIELLKEYVEAQDAKNDAELDEFVLHVQKQKAALDKLIVTYTKKVRKACNAKTAAQFYQFETYLLEVVRVSIMDQIPFIGELKQ